MNRRSFLKGLAAAPVAVPLAAAVAKDALSEETIVDEPVGELAMQEPQGRVVWMKLETVSDGSNNSYQYDLGDNGTI